MKKIFEGARADFSWGHLSVDGFERATEDFGKAVWDANDRVVVNPNLIVRITVETVMRPIVPGSTWKSKTRSTEFVVGTIDCDEDGGAVYYFAPGGEPLCLHIRTWYRDNEWVSDPEPKP